MALVGWLVPASTDTVGQVLILSVVTDVVGVRHPHSAGQLDQAQAQE